MASVKIDVYDPTHVLKTCGSYGAPQALETYHPRYLQSHQADSKDSSSFKRSSKTMFLLHTAHCWSHHQEKMHVPRTARYIIVKVWGQANRLLGNLWWDLISTYNNNNSLHHHHFFITTVNHAGFFRRSIWSHQFRPLTAHCKCNITIQ